MNRSIKCAMAVVITIAGTSLALSDCVDNISAGGPDPFTRQVNSGAFDDQCGLLDQCNPLDRYADVLANSSCDTLGPDTNHFAPTNTALKSFRLIMVAKAG
jgi:hypothetical protein